MGPVREPPHKRFKALFEGTQEGREDEETVEPTACDEAVDRFHLANSNAAPHTGETPPESIAPSKSLRSKSIPLAASAPISKPEKARSGQQQVLPKDPSIAASKPSLPPHSHLKKSRPVVSREDSVDPEFPQLNASSSLLELRKQDAKREEDKFWDDFDKDVDLRGNFMVIQLVDLYRKDNQNFSGSDVRPSWVGKPNFKQFKKVSSHQLNCMQCLIFL